MIFIPPPLRLTKKCERCGLRYPLRAQQCVHCAELNNQELDELKARIKLQQRGYRRLGWLFFYIAVMMFIAMLLTS